MIEAPFSKFSYTGYRKNPKNLFNSVTMVSYPKKIKVNLMSVPNTIFTKIRSNNNQWMPLRLKLLHNLNLTVLLILEIIFTINNRITKAFLMINFNHIHRNCLPELEDHWVI